MTSPFELASFDCPLLEHFKQQQANLLSLQSKLFQHLLSHNDHYNCCEEADCLKWADREYNETIVDLKVSTIVGQIINIYRLS